MRSYWQYFAFIKLGWPICLGLELKIYIYILSGSKYKESILTWTQIEICLADLAVLLTRTRKLGHTEQHFQDLWEWRFILSQQHVTQAAFTMMWQVEGMQFCPHNKFQEIMSILISFLSNLLQGWKSCSPLIGFLHYVSHNENDCHDKFSMSSTCD